MVHRVHFWTDESDEETLSLARRVRDEARAKLAAAGVK